MLQVYICAPEVLMLFQDNFDYQVTCPQSLRHPAISSAFPVSVTCRLSSIC